MNIEQFKKDVNEGLSKQVKTLPSKYFYDKKGDELFVKIMSLPEYYLTRSEFEIFSLKSLDLIEKLQLDKNKYFELIELGAGDGSKTVELLKVLSDGMYDFKYTPIDISPNTLDVLESNINKQIPELKINKLAGDYFNQLGLLKENTHPKIILFLGSNIGNLTDEQSSQFLIELTENLNQGDQLILGLDLRKSKSIVLPAYSDSKGVTKQFNLNLLNRINENLNADFNISQFSHIAEYNEEEGIARSYILSTTEQEVKINKLDKIFKFSKGERIHTEISRKYDDEILKEIITPTNLKIKDKLVDSNNLFADYILQKTL